MGMARLLGESEKEQKLESFSEEHEKTLEHTHLSLR
jgi:hypothetical protein